VGGGPGREMRRKVVPMAWRRQSKLVASIRVIKRRRERQNTHELDQS
jgi:hypothetical protein